MPKQYALRLTSHHCVHFLATLLIPLVTRAAPAAPAPPAAPQWGSYLTPFAADSLWNARPVAPVLGGDTIPTSRYFPSAASGDWSTGVFLSKESDPPVQVEGTPGKNGVWDPDTETEHAVTLPHWPAEVTPAKGNDGHADIVDPTTGIIHSFWQLRFRDGHWTAAMYAWTRLNGSGWGDPAHYHQGARAAGVPPLAGILRKQEVDDGAPYYHHALAMSLTYNALAANPVYIFPATSADNNAATTNTGKIPEGALLMLPPSYDTAHIANPALRKIAETLKRYGAYVVDRNDGTPFALYVENGARFDLHAGGWNNAVANELQLIRAGLRQVVSTQGFVDGNGKNFTPQKNLNLLSMRGNWGGPGAPASGHYDSWSQSVVFGDTKQKVELFNVRNGDFTKQVLWATPTPGATCRLLVLAKGGAKLRLQVRNGDNSASLFDSGALADQGTRSLPCPVAGQRIELRAISGIGKSSSVRGELTVATK